LCDDHAHPDIERKQRTALVNVFHGFLLMQWNHSDQKIRSQGHPMKEQIRKHPAKTWLFQAKRSPCHPVFFVENYLVDIFLSRVKFNMKCRNICFIFSFCGSNPEHMSRKHAFVQWQNLA